MSAPEGRGERTPYFPEVESLRGWAIALVVLFHCDGILLQRAVVPDASLASAFVAAGMTGVNLFFVLSGFLLVQPFLRAATGGPSVNTVRFLARRALRIMPLYVLVVCLATWVAAHSAWDLLRAIPYLFFLQGVHGATVPMHPLSDPWWSLSTEVQFYLLLPGLAALLTSWARVVGAGVIYGAAYLGMLYHWTPFGLGGELALRASAFGRGWLFAAGAAAAWIWTRHGVRLQAWFARSRAGLTAADVALVAVVVALGTLLRTVARTGTVAVEGGRLHAWHVPEALLYGTLVVVLVAGRGPLKGLLVNETLRRVGVLSYSIYLTHLFVLPLVLPPGVHDRLASLPSGIGWTLRATLAVAVGIGLTLVVSTCTYLLVERPFLVRKNRVAT